MNGPVMGLVTHADSTSGPHSAFQLLELGRQTRFATSLPELAFLVVNDSRGLCEYRQAALWFEEGGVKTLSGVVEPEANAPYTQWVDQVCRFLANTHDQVAPIEAVQCPAELAAEWAEWLPAYGLWLPFPGGGVLFAADAPWSAPAATLLAEWVAIWHHAWLALSRPAFSWSWKRVKQAGIAFMAQEPDLPYWKQRRTRVAAAVAACLLFPVRLSVLAPGELVPANPAVIRAPVDGVVGQFLVQPNESVKAGQVLFTFDEAASGARREVAAQSLATAQAEYRQYAQQALADSKAKAQLAPLLGKIEEKRAEADYARNQDERSRVVAPQDGVAQFDDPSEWIGKPVQTGERIMRIAAPGDVELEAWLPIGDAIPLAQGNSVSLYLAASPFASVDARIRYVAYEAVPRPDGSYAYRLRAKLDSPAGQRVGLKGTARVNGGWVPFVYWMLRRPLATIRQTVGL